MVQLTSLISTLTLAIAAVQAAPGASLAARQLPDPSGAQNVGNGAEGQFIGGECLGAADCASGCCASFPSNGQIIGVCSGPAVGDQNGKLGCGFEANGGGAANDAAGNGNNQQNNNGNQQNNNGNQQNNNGNQQNNNGNQQNNNGNQQNNGGNNGEIAVIPTDLLPDPVNGLQSIGAGDGSQFITGECLSDDDCASGCCSTVNNGNDEPFGICSGPLASTQNGKQCCGFPNGPLNCPPGTTFPLPGAVDN